MASPVEIRSVERLDSSSAQGVRRPQVSRSAQVLAVLERLADAVAVSLSIIVADSFYHYFDLGRHIRYGQESLVAAAFFIGASFVITLDRSRGYQESNSLLGIRETERILRATAHTFLLILAFMFLSGQLISRWTCAIAVVLIPVFVLVEKHLVLSGVRFLHSRGLAVQNVLVYGGGEIGRRVVSGLAKSPKLGLRPVAIADDETVPAFGELNPFGYNRNQSVPVLNSKVNAQLLIKLQVSSLIVAIPSLSDERFQYLSSECEDAGVRLYFVPKLTTEQGHFVEYMDVDGLLIGTALTRSTDPWSTLTKRAFDLLSASLGFLFILPIWLLIAAFVKIDSKGPVLFSQLRVGKNGELFKMYKFRTMYTDTPKYDFHPKSQSDPRITKVGRYLRRTSLDELPQILNVIKGDMSLVGPRPEMPFIVDQYTAQERRRLEALPGITGLWQLSADRDHMIHENIHYDLYYIRNRNFFMDLAVLAHTLIFAAKGV